MTNTSGLKPLGRAVLVRMYEPERKQSMIEIPDVVQERSDMVNQRALVIELGANCWHDEPTPRCQPGDKVLVTKFAGFLALGADGKRYRLVNDRDIFCGITKEAKEN